MIGPTVPARARLVAGDLDCPLASLSNSVDSAGPILTRRRDVLTRPAGRAAAAGPVRLEVPRPGAAGPELKLTQPTGILITDWHDAARHTVTLLPAARL